MNSPLRLDFADPDGWPGRRQEDWRWTDVRRAAGSARPASAPFDAWAQGPFDAFADRVHVVANGRAAADGRLDPGDAKSLALRWLGRGAGAHGANLGLAVGPGKDLVILESLEGEGSYGASHTLSLEVGAEARLTRIVLATEPEDAVSRLACEVTLAPAAEFRQIVLTDGARLQRIETVVRHEGGGAAARLDGVFVLAGARFADQTTEVDHVRPDGSTRQKIKGVVSDSARAVFQGRIVVREGADGADARMGCHGLILSDRAEIDAKPELEIWADDVACGHGATIGALDAEALFYLRSRGLEEREARRMLTIAFLEEILDDFPASNAIREVLVAWLKGRLETVA